MKTSLLKVSNVFIVLHKNGPYTFEKNRIFD